MAERRGNSANFFRRLKNTEVLRSPYPKHLLNRNEDHGGNASNPAREISPSGSSGVALYRPQAVTYGTSQYRESPGSTTPLPQVGSSWSPTESMLPPHMMTGLQYRAPQMYPSSAQPIRFRYSQHPMMQVIPGSTFPIHSPGYDQPNRQNETPEYKILTNWHLVLEFNKRTVIIGGNFIKSNGEAVNRHSSAIERRLDPHNIVSQSGAAYRLVGPMNSEASRQKGFPEPLIQRFASGFPADWKEQIESFIQAALGLNQPDPQNTSVMSQAPCNIDQDMRLNSSSEPRSTGVCWNGSIETHESGINQRYGMFDQQETELSNILEEPSDDSLNNTAYGSPVPGDVLHSRPNRITQNETALQGGLTKDAGRIGTGDMSSDTRISADEDSLTRDQIPSRPKRYEQPITGITEQQRPVSINKHKETFHMHDVDLTDDNECSDKNRYIEREPASAGSRTESVSVGTNERNLEEPVISALHGENKSNVESRDDVVEDSEAELDDTTRPTPLKHTPATSVSNRSKVFKTPSSRSSKKGKDRRSNSSTKGSGGMRLRDKANKASSSAGKAGSNEKHNVVRHIPVLRSRDRTDSKTSLEIDDKLSLISTNETDINEYLQTPTKPTRRATSKRRSGTLDMVAEERKHSKYRARISNAGSKKMKEMKQPTSDTEQNDKGPIHHGSIADNTPDGDSGPELQGLDNDKSSKAPRRSRRLSDKPLLGDGRDAFAGDNNSTTSTTSIKTLSKGDKKAPALDTSSEQRRASAHGRNRKRATDRSEEAEASENPNSSSSTDEIPQTKTPEIRKKNSQTKRAQTDPVKSKRQMKHVPKGGLTVEGSSKTPTRSHGKEAKTLLRKHAEIQVKSATPKGKKTSANVHTPKRTQDMGDESASGITRSGRKVRRPQQWWTNALDHLNNKRKHEEEEAAIKYKWGSDVPVIVKGAKHMRLDDYFMEEEETSTITRSKARGKRGSTSKDDSAVESDSDKGLANAS